MDNIRVLIADDHPVVRQGLKGMLETQKDFELAGEAQNGMEAVEMANTTQPHVVLMDLRMPEMDGVEAIREIKRNHPLMSILVLTTYDSEADIIFAIEAGASGYLLKDAAAEDLFNAIRTARRGDTALSPPVAKRILNRVRTAEVDRLTNCEIAVLCHVAKGIRNREIANIIGVSEATVKSHLGNIYQKLGVADRTAAVTRAIKDGIIQV
jgi:DNA-binding NarL/FixJ family response regulator